MCLFFVDQRDMEGDSSHLSYDPTTLSKKECKMFDEVRKRSDREARALQRMARTLCHARDMIKNRHEREAKSVRCAMYDVCTRTPNLQRHVDVKTNPVRNNKTTDSNITPSTSYVLETNASCNSSAKSFKSLRSPHLTSFSKISSPCNPGAHLQESALEQEANIVQQRIQDIRMSSVPDKQCRLKLQRDYNLSPEEKTKFLRTTTKNYVRRAEVIDKALQTVYTRRLGGYNNYVGS